LVALPFTTVQPFAENELPVSNPPSPVGLINVVWACNCWIVGHWITSRAARKKSKDLRLETGVNLRFIEQFGVEKYKSASKYAESGTFLYFLQEFIPLFSGIATD
jgi:hypothetical protein